MTIDGQNMRERLPFLLEHAAELGVPVEVRPQISRTGVDHLVAAATVTIHADVGTMPTDLDVAGERNNGTLVGTWLQVVGAHDLEFAANLRRHRVVDGDGPGIEPGQPQTYTLGRAVPAAAALLDVDLQKDGIRAAVQIRPESPAHAAIDELVVDWPTVTAPTRSHGAITLALIARSLLHGDPVDVSGLAHVHRDYADAAAYAFSRLAATG